jgi:hypothetical protein
MGNKASNTYTIYVQYGNPESDDVISRYLSQRSYVPSEPKILTFKRVLTGTDEVEWITSLDAEY